MPTPTRTDAIDAGIVRIRDTDLGFRCPAVPSAHVEQVQQLDTLAESLLIAVAHLGADLDLLHVVGLPEAARKDARELSSLLVAARRLAPRFMEHRDSLIARM